ncbi:MAG: hypothetical protein JXB15_12825 [Anaerolineales bacterium]|nr:hypothetical protein [Anaerolineales bacterium]
MQPEFEAILAADQPELEKVTRAFQWIIAEHTTHSRHEIELLRALGDQENLVKEQIKLAAIEHALSIYAFCYQRATGRRLGNEQSR